jgi:hypothetical protein
MEREVIFRDYQKAQTEDFNNLQDYAKQTFDDVVGDAVTASLRYAGFNTVKSNTAEITVSAGRFYGANSTGSIGAIFALPTQSIISMVQYLCISQVTTKILTLVCYGVNSQVNVETRDYLTNTQTLQTQPQAVAMTSSRDAVLGVVAGAESGNPTPPVIGVGQVAIANIIVDANGIDSIAMLPTSQVTSTEDLNSRLEVVELFDDQVGPRLTALASDLASLQNQLNGLNLSQSAIVQLMQDVSVLKVLAGLPAVYSFYGASNFMWPDPAQFDTNNSLNLGFNCNISFGARFPASNANVFALAMFNPIDPNASYNASSGLLLPAYTSVLKLSTGAVTTSIAMGQYTFQTFSYTLINIPYMRIREGGGYEVCTNNGEVVSIADTSTPAWWLPNFSTYLLYTSQTDYPATYAHPYSWYQVNYFWLDTWTEPYWKLDETDHSVNGALLAQTFLVSSDMWITKIGIWVTNAAGPTDINLILCQCTNGQPDLTLVIAQGTLVGSSIQSGAMNYLLINPSFVQKGQRMAVVAISNANHNIGMATAGSYLDGTFFYSLDSAYFLGDFTKEMVLEIWGAQFTTNQVAIQLTALNLAGGIRNIDLTIRAQIPASCQLVYEVQPAGTGLWLPITPDSPLVPFANAPVLCAFRARFIGSPDIMPGIVLPDSICNIWVPNSTFTYVSEMETLATVATTISVKIRVEHFNLTAHSLDGSHGDFGGYIRLYYGGPLVSHNWSSLTYTLVDPTLNAYDILATFTGVSTNTFSLVVHGTTNSVSNVFHLARVIWWE